MRFPCGLLLFHLDNLRLCLGRMRIKQSSLGVKQVPAAVFRGLMFTLFRNINVLIACKLLNVNEDICYCTFNF